jgi:hypothetical protein
MKHLIKTSLFSAFLGLFFISTTQAVKLTMSCTATELYDNGVKVTPKGIPASATFTDDDANNTVKALTERRWNVQSSLGTVLEVTISDKAIANNNLSSIIGRSKEERSWTVSYKAPFKEGKYIWGVTGEVTGFYVCSAWE